MDKTGNNKFKGFLFKPYPHIERRWVILVLIPLFISLFMVTFQPFGLQMFSHEHKSLLLVGYGPITFIVLTIDMYLLKLIMPGLFREEKWKVISEVLYLIWIVLTISIGNYAYSVMVSIGSWHGLNGLLIFIGFTFAVAIIPIFAIIIISHNVMLRKNLAGAKEVSKLIAGKEAASKDEMTIRLSSANEQQSVDILVYQLLCIESEGNYINVWCLEEGKVIQHVIRNTVKNIEAQLEGNSGLFRCHRAYIVNLGHIEHAEGNSQGYRLKLKYLQKEIPVSRNYTKAFNTALRDWS